MKILSKKETGQILGGTVLVINENDNIKNTNKVSGCKCTYLDNSAVENNNMISGCLCTCKGSNLTTL